jgi:CheY-like chemotaxis protein
MKPAPRDPGKLIKTFESVLRRAVRSDIRFEVSLAPDSPQILVDSAQFETALLNLVVNARDATPEGGRVTVSTSVTALKANEVDKLPAGQYVLVSVQDTGEGMTPDVISRAVEPFFTTKPVGQGTGLGLSQVYGMVQGAGGELSIKSFPGHGATVTMVFPALAGRAEEAAQRPSSEKVLLVDDQPDVLTITREMFRTLGFEVLVASTGGEALEVLQRTPGIHLMLTDLVMPGMDGIQLAKKAQGVVPALKVILASGYVSPGIEAENINGFFFLPKPYRMMDVVRTLREIGA